VDERLPYTHDFGPYCTEHSTSVSSAEHVDVDSGLTLTGSLSSNVWAGTVQATTPGSYQYRLKGTMADGTIQIILFQVDIKEGRSGVVY
jgi:hypothetical protein